MSGSWGPTSRRRDGWARNVSRTRARVGVVFQQFNLVSRLSLLTNVLLGALGRIPRWRSWFCRFTREEKLLAMEALQRVGMADRATQRASTLSGGQQQRAAIARTLVQQAEIVLADEPIASLDPESARRVMENLAKVNREDGITVVVSLHQVDFAIRFCPRTVALRDGPCRLRRAEQGPDPRFPSGTVRRRQRGSHPARHHRGHGYIGTRRDAGPGPHAGLHDRLGGGLPL